MSWLDHLILTVSPVGRALAGQNALLVTRTGVTVQAAAALSRELGCAFTILRPPASEQALGGVFPHVRGFCWSARLPAQAWCGGQDPGQASPLRLLEEGRDLSPPGSPIGLIASQGQGRFLHWRRRLFFSTPDNSNPNRNGRGYLIRVEPEPRGGQTLDWAFDCRGRLFVDPVAAGAIRSSGIQIALLAEPPDRNLPRLARELRQCGLKSLLLLAGPRWISLPLDRFLLLRPALLGPWADRSARRAARALGSRLGAARSRGGPVVEHLLNLARNSGSLVSRPALSPTAKASGPGKEEGRSEPGKALFLRSLAADQIPPGREPEQDLERLRIVQYIGQLGPGGAERQMSYLSARLNREGHRVRVVTAVPLAGDAAHYVPLLDKEGVPWAPAGKSQGSDLLVQALAHQGLKSNLLAHIPPNLSGRVRDLLADLISFRPQVVHCWLDWNNIIGGLAAYLAGTPLIVLSTRNVNPTHFPRFYRPWQKEWYGFLAQSPRVCFTANSRAGALDYASWLGLAQDSIQVIKNGLDPGSSPRPRAKESENFRQELGLSPGELLVGGVFRLDPEKRPYDFLKVIKTALGSGPGFKAVIVGQGTLERKLARDIQRFGLGGTVRLLGRREDVGRIMAACQAVLLTSAQEGTPNVLMEAQMLGRPVVATRVGGVAETVAEGRSALLHRPGDIPAMAASLVRLLVDPELRRRMGRAGQAHVQREFDLARTTQATLELYLSRLGRTGRPDLA